MKRRTVLHASLAGLGAWVPGWGLAQSGSGRAVELIVPYAAGGGVDAMARAVFATCVREGAVLVRLEEAGTRLEDVFRDLTLPSPAP